MTKIVRLHDVVNEMQVFDDESHAFLKRVTGELFTVTSGELTRRVINRTMRSEAFTCSRKS